MPIALFASSVPILQLGGVKLVARLKSGYYDAAYITGQEYDKLKDSDITAISYTDATLALVLNKNNTIFSNDKLRQAVCLSISDIDTKK